MISWRAFFGRAPWLCPEKLFKGRAIRCKSSLLFVSLRFVPGFSLLSLTLRTDSFFIFMTLNFWGGLERRMRFQKGFPF